MEDRSNGEKFRTQTYLTMFSDEDLKKYLKKYFDSNRIGIVKNETGKVYPSYNPIYYYRMESDGVVKYYGGNWGNYAPAGTVSKVYKVASNLYQAEYSVSLNNKATGTVKQLGDFIVTFRKNDSSYYIVDILRIRSASSTLF